MPDYKTFNLKITALTPLHIGTGRELMNDDDYAIFGPKTWVINQSALLDSKNVDDPKVAAQLEVMPPAKLLEDEDFVEGSRFFHYVLKGVPRSASEGIQLREQFKNVFNQPYLPGSSLKGALRTVLGWHAWKELKLEPNAANLKPRREWAGSNYEQEIFGASPNTDFMRALQVGDSKPLDPACLHLLNVRIVNEGGGMSAPVEMEAVRSETVFNCSMKLDAALFSDWAKKYGLKLKGEAWLKDLPRIANLHARERAAAEAGWFKKLSHASLVFSTYEQLKNAQLAPNQFLLRLGWGTGWEDKTFGSRLQADEDFMEHILVQYRMYSGKREYGDAFPRSRRAGVSRLKAADGSVRESLAKPLGWVLVEMNER